MECRSIELKKCTVAERKVRFNKSPTFPDIVANVIQEPRNSNCVKKKKLTIAKYKKKTAFWKSEIAEIGEKGTGSVGHS